jgi:hypothetical protein
MEGRESRFSKIAVIPVKTISKSQIHQLCVTPISTPIGLYREVSSGFENRGTAHVPYSERTCRIGISRNGAPKRKGLGDQGNFSPNFVKQILWDPTSFETRNEKRSIKTGMNTL